MPKQLFKKLAVPVYNTGARQALIRMTAYKHGRINLWLEDEDGTMVSPMLNVPPESLMALSEYLGELFRFAVGGNDDEGIHAGTLHLLHRDDTGEV